MFYFLKKLTTIFFFLIFTDIAAAELVKANPNLSALDVLKIQLNSLKINDNPYPDAGIEQTWELAHPNNKKFTGPLPKFKKMIYSKDYKILLNHISHEIEILLESNSTYVFKVKVKTKQNEIYFYEWQITKVKYDKLLKGCWMTSSVSRPNLVGEQV
tara:strand:- start:562 stop:1032 length:471 start_codon:yes stop_codon:yes gene_type:complete